MAEKQQASFLIFRDFYRKSNAIKRLREKQFGLFNFFNKEKLVEAFSYGFLIPTRDGYVKSTISGNIPF
ncbi:MAG: hypothetical protein INR73_28255 [Williamsia sp.]|nr:hypothetical protein [Williamsia sp.]